MTNEVEYIVLIDGAPGQTGKANRTNSGKIIKGGNNSEVDSDVMKRSPRSCQLRMILERSVNQASVLAKVMVTQTQRR